MEKNELSKYTKIKKICIKTKKYILTGLFNLYIEMILRELKFLPGTFISGYHLNNIR